MIARITTFALAALLLPVSTTLGSMDSYFEEGNEETSRELGYFRGSNFCGRFGKKLALKVINLTRAQPFAPNFFVMIHNNDADPLYEFNMKASDELAELAKNGNAADLVALYDGAPGVGVVGTTAAPVDGVPPPGAALPGGDPLYIDIDAVSRTYPYVTIASMFVNSNDGFAAINGQILRKGNVLYLNGLDAGAEANTENCDDMPGPACPDDSSNGDPAEPDDTQFVRVHSGFFGVEGGSLPAESYDWRNPMLRVEVTCADEDMVPALVLP